MQPNPFKLERYFSQHEFTARHLLCTSDPESMSIGELLAYEPDSIDGLRDTWLGYTEYPGAPALRRELATLYENIDADEIIVHTGAQEAIYSFMNTMLAPGDHMIVHMPGYQSHYTVAEALGVSVAPWKAREEAGWSLDPAELETLVTPATRALVMCVPHNPTGYLPSRDVFDAIVAFARKHGLWLFSDEVYRGLEHDRADRLPAACDVYERAISLGALSKTHGLAGLRLGWIATKSAQVLERMSTFKDYLTISNSAPSEYLSAIAVRHTDALIERNVSMIRANLGVLDAFFARHADRFEWHRPRAGTIGFVRLKREGAERFCAELLERTGVLLLPSTLVDHGDEHVRLGFGRRNMPDVLAIVDAYLDATVTSTAS
ncbi:MULTISPECIES: aminotransferase class I/II-fold pyridoxal phosphate-dependent enzyme [Caballeronia]|uniref:Aminotransferase n=2 Tax=Caballeronia TaxID=1827195 RepID=A0A656QJU7_9BURK|nr:MULTISPECIES: aminotransferase class I/II-fold pyridoxal phosphate-dependent enzyme [Caballeronia]EKS66576.1 class I and II aminotransferase [Burkholderia sp. SJ98]KDR30840.1 aminotransferase [Caballeronia zhejiangensis]MDR5790148.1 aminotransferase class I/II-fold pyridoxal phosphate-dependent enzyme [Caballeronia sp. LP003]